jgi:uncharacterized BrkB/YihY/UPF0761 family membrane protein
VTDREERDEPRKAWLGERVAAAQVLGERTLSWGVARVRGVEAGLEAFDLERRGGGTLLAGGLAYRLFFWLLPLGLTIAALLSFWREVDPDGIDDAARELGMGAAAARSASQAIADSTSSQWYFLLAGLWFVGYFSLGVLRALRLSFALAWGVPPERLRRPFAAVALYNGVALGLMASGTFAAWVRAESDVLGLLVTLAMFLVYGGVALAVMRLLPHGEAPTRALLPGAILVAIGTQAIHLLVTLYLAPRLGRSSELYGSLGAATVILLWLYLTARLIVAAAFLNATVWRRRVHRAANDGLTAA